MIKVILVGYMGAGKTIIGQFLSKKTGVKFVDLDKYIELKENLTIKNIFSNKGEIYFRKLEHATFKEIIQSKEALIIATGGGTPCYYNNHELLNEKNIISVYLKANVETLYNRLLPEYKKRPLIAEKNPDELKEFIAKQLFERSYFYNLCQFKITVDEKLPEAIATEIQQLLT